ncbi:MAG: hypothetical protein HN745_09180 [Deltaproteobacteria bacterium]|jgi:hypothetical protein|nr:hypothetical protein [Deltaproteobacteria bacterium]
MTQYSTTENADRETIFKLFQTIAEYGHRVRTGQKRLLLPEKADSFPAGAQKKCQRPDESK